MLLVNVMNNQNEVNVIMQDYFDIVGTIVNTLVIIYYFYLKKFMETYEENLEEDITTNFNSFRTNRNLYNPIEESEPDIYQTPESPKIITL